MCECVLWALCISHYSGADTTDLHGVVHILLSLFLLFFYINFFTFIYFNFSIMFFFVVLFNYFFCCFFPHHYLKHALLDNNLLAYHLMFLRSPWLGIPILISFVARVIPRSKSPKGNR